MRGIRYMKIFEIIDEENNMSIGVLQYYEKEKNCIIELQENLDEWTAPLLFTSYVNKHIYTMPRDISFMWVRERVIPSGRQNIKDILNNHGMKSYDEMRFLEISEGRCSQDSLYIKQLNALPDYVIERKKKNIIDCVTLDNNVLLCFFADNSTKKIDLHMLEYIKGVEKIINNKLLYESGMVGTDGYFATFNDSIDIQADTLYKAGTKVSLSLHDFKTFIRKNVVDTSEACNILECSRQNIAYMIAQEQLGTIKEDVRGSLYLKGEVVSKKW